MIATGREAVRHKLMLVFRDLIQRNIDCSRCAKENIGKGVWRMFGSIERYEHIHRNCGDEN